MDGVINVLDSFFMWLNSVLKQNLADYIDLETAQDEVTMVNKDGSLLSVIRVNGCRSIIDGEQYLNLSQTLTSKIEDFFGKPGHSMQIWFSCDPRKSEQVVKEVLRPSYETVNRLNLDLSEILDERVDNISEIAIYEECYIVLYTNIESLVKSEVSQEIKDKRKIRMESRVPLKYSQDPFAANGLLQNKHSAFVESIRNIFLKEIGISCDLLTVREAAREVRMTIDESFTDVNWEPSLVGDRVAPTVRKQTNHDQTWEIISPKLSWQVAPRDAEIVDKKLVVVGDKVFAPGYIDLMPKKVTGFSYLLNSIGRKYPWRISLYIEGGGLAALGIKSIFASVIAAASQNNKLLNKGIKELREMRDEYGIVDVKMQAAYCTWGHNDVKGIEKVKGQFAELSNTITSWGGCQVSEITGDPLAGMLSSALGVSKNSIATISAMPLNAVMFMSPFNRPSSPWRTGSVLFVSPDNKIMPYQPGSRLQSTWIQIIFAGPGSGKSMLMNVMNMALCLAPGITRLPRIGIIDIGPSSAGLISLLKEALPYEQKHLVQHYRFRMTEEYAINPFDTYVGCRYPTAEQKSYLINLVTLLATEAGEKSQSGMSDLVSLVIDDMYESLSDKAKPRKYDAGVNFIVDDAIEKTKMVIDGQTSWWDVVDHLFLAGRVHEATLAQRNASPILYEASSSVHKEKVRGLFSNDMKVVTQETLINYFVRTISSATENYKVLSRPTRFDIGDARVVAFDIDEVTQGAGEFAEKQVAVMYMLARYVLGKDFKIAPATVNDMPYPSSMIAPENVPVKAYKDYHSKKIEDTKEDYKRICFDEFHRTKSAQAVRNQVFLDMREGRKFKIDVTLASQSVEDFDVEMREFVTSVFIMGEVKSDSFEKVCKVFSFETESEMFYLKRGIRAPGNGRAGVFMAKFFTNMGNYSQLLQLHIGAIERWALSTDNDEVVIRDMLYKRIGPVPARRLLSKKYKFGTGREVEERKLRMKEGGFNSSNSDELNNTVYKNIVEDLMREAGYN